MASAAGAAGVAAELGGVAPAIARGSTGLAPTPKRVGTSMVADSS